MLTESSSQIRILIVDDHKIMRQGLRMLIGSRPDMLVIGEAGDRGEAVALATREHPDIIILDLDLGGHSSLEFLPELLSLSRNSRVLVLTGIRDCAEHQKAVLLGAMGLVMKDKAAEVLLRAIEKVHEGEAWLDHALTADVIARVTRPRKPDVEAAKIATLTDREHEILVLICAGLKNKEVGGRLCISELTVRNHLTSILGKLGLSDRFELALYSYRHGLALPPSQ